MTRVNVPLSKLTFSQKLDLMETLWADLTRNEKRFKSPEWHEDVLRDREKALMSGKTTTTDWEVAKKRIQKKLS